MSVDPLKSTVLIVYDEQLQAETAGRFLTLQGFSTKVFIDSKAALDWFKLHFEEVAVVLLDYKMPTVNGRMFLREIREIAELTKVALVTGFRREDLPPLNEYGVAHFFRKPVRLEKLGAWVKQSLESEP